MEPAAANDMIPGMIEFSRSQGMSVKTSSELFTQQFKDHKRAAQRRYQAVTGQISQAMQALRELKVAEDDIAESKPLVAAILYLYSLRMRDQ